MWQGFTGGQLAPEVQPTQLPPEQTSLVPQLVPLGRAAPESVQTGMPLPQRMTPAWQDEPGSAQADPSTQATQLPAEQTWLLPQEVPSG